jgi:hypothetical protein
MTKKFRDQDEYNLGKTIQAYWAKRGCTVKIYPAYQRARFDPNRSQMDYMECVRTDMINGLPLDYKGRGV